MSSAAEGAILEAKRRLRTSISKRRREFAIASRQAASEVIAQSIIAAPEFLTAKRLIAYCALADEVDVTAVCRAALADGRDLALPQVVNDRILFRKVDDLDVLAADARGLFEPDSTAIEVLPTSGDLVLVPGVAFDSTGRRLGRGGGHYDRALAAAGCGAVTLGVAFAIQVVDEIPIAPHDRRVDALVTESEFSRLAPGDRFDEPS